MCGLKSTSLPALNYSKPGDFQTASAYIHEVLRLHVPWNVN